MFNIVLYSTAICRVSIIHCSKPWWRHQMETFTRNWPFVRGIHRFPMNSPHKGQWRGALMFSLICVWINGWVNNREVGDLRRYGAHSDVTVMYYLWWVPGSHRLVGGRATCLAGWHISARKQRGKVSAQLITLFAQLALCGGGGGGIPRSPAELPCCRWYQLEQNVI